VNRAIIWDFVFPPLFNVRITDGDEVFNNLHISFLASYEERSTAFFHPAGNFSSLWLEKSLKSNSERI
jgi:hypothetical protein